MISRIVYRAGIGRRNPSLIPYLEFLQESDGWSREKLEQYQTEKCRELLLFASRHSPYYRKAFIDASFDPASLASLSALKQVPSIDKSILLSRNKDIHAVAEFGRVFASETSGTSGQVLKFCRNEEWDSGSRAAMFRGYSWFGVKPWDRNGYFWGYNTAGKYRAKTAALDWLQNRFRVFSYGEREVTAFAGKLRRAVYLHGYSSMIYEVAKIVNRLQMQGQYSLKMIKGTSEKVYDAYQDEVTRAFGKRIINEYGACESGIIAYECPNGSMHICSENVVVEEENGEILVTNLLSRSFPIIRYKLGDSIKLADSGFRCSCGRAHPVILDVLGRVGKSVIGKVQSYPSLTFYYVFKNLALTKNVALNYQAVQEEEGRVLLKIEQAEGKFKDDLIHELRKYFQDDIDFEIRFNQRLHTMDGKLRDFITSIA